MRILAFSIFLTVAVAHADDSPDRRALATAEAAVARIEPLAPGRDFVWLPTLKFALSLQPRCPSASDTAAVLISIADTRVALTSVDPDAVESVETALTLPAQQTGPVRVAGFCRADQPDAARELVIEGIFTARVSLRCSAGDTDSISYATLPLDVILACNRGDQVP